MRRFVACAAMAMLAIGPAGVARAAAGTAYVDLTIDHELLAALATRELGGAAAAGPVWESGDGCTALTLEALRVEPVDTALGVSGQGEGRVGVGLLGWCLLPFDRSMRVSLRARPTIGDDWQLRLVDVTSELREADGRTTFVTRRLTELVGPRLDEAVARVTVDLTPPAADIRALFAGALDRTEVRGVEAALESLRPLEAVVAQSGVRVRLAMDVPPTSGAAPEGPEPPPTEEERRQWAARLESWDGFFTFVVKHLGVRDADREMGDELFALFVDGRNELVEALGAAPVRGDDPVRRLFLRRWSGLRRIVEKVARRHPEDDGALRYVRFLAAGDALAALDRMGPGLGLRVSTDGLRRLARTLDPVDPQDPLATSGETDPVLRRLLGFHEPRATPSPDAAPARAPSEPRSRWRPAWPAVAHAAEVEPRDALDGVGRRLSRWVPTTSDRDRYRDAVSQLLDRTAELEWTGDERAADGRPFFRRLVRAIAWQESCWRQFVRRGGRVTFLESGTGDVGMMQVNRRVWRGVFDARLLEWDVVYNADAGTQIAAQFLARYGRPEARVAGGHAARATYAAYNGGPTAHQRYRTGHRATDYTRRVDRAFWEKFRVVEAGGELAHVPCIDEA